MKYTPFGVDIAKHLIQVHFINEHTGEVVDKQLRSKDFLTFFSNREPCLPDWHGGLWGLSALGT